MAANKDYPPITPNTYKATLPANVEFEFVSAYTIFPYRVSTGSFVGTAGFDSDTYTQEVFIDNDKVFSNTFIISRSLNDIRYQGEDVGVKVQLKNNSFYKVVYTYKTSKTNYSNFTNTVSYTFSAVENKLPLKKWSITDVLNRLLDLAEPIRKGEMPRFRFNAEQAAQFEKVLAPQFSFTKQTLRECLQEVGRFIHGEPRLTPKKDEDGVWYYEVGFEMYVRQDHAGIYTKPYIKKTVSELIDSYTSYLDSNAENLVNQLDKFSGVIVEPYRDGGQSVRTENAYVRIEEGNMLIATRYPIYSVEKIEYVTSSSPATAVDITPYLFEKSVYDSQLSSYREQYPYSKAYGLYYAQGSKNIGGLNFKVDDAIGGVFKEYAIVNILRQATGNNNLTIDSYPEMCFRVTYTPYYNARVAQTKVNYKDFKYPAALIYNQQANVVESRYYGEHLKGAVARLGNVDKSYTYIMSNIDFIPKAGQMYDKDYYISAVAVIMYPTCFLVTIGLSKDFQRISGYIGINSEKRYSEISQNQAVARNTLYHEYIVVGAQDTPDSDCLIGQNLLEMIANTFTQTGTYQPLSNVCAWGTSYQGNDIAAVNLPVISSAFGNSISFSWEYEDNYSAGPTATYQSNGNVKGYFQSSAPYTDYYGRLYYYNFDLQPRGPAPAIPAAFLAQALKQPQGTKPTASSDYVSTVGQQPYVMRKDNREALQVNYQVDFVSNLDNLIIGSALSSYCPAVRGSDSSLAAKLYVFDTELNKFTDHVEAYENVDLAAMPSVDVTVSVGNGYFTVSAEEFPKTETGAANGKSWAIITNQYKKDAVWVEDEFGNETEQKEVYGGDLLIGQNIPVTAGQAFTPIYFTKKREIFDKTVWKDRL